MAENENASLASNEAIAGKLVDLVEALEQICIPNVDGGRVEVGFLNVVKGGTSIHTGRLRTFLNHLEGGKGFDGSTHEQHVTVFQELVRQYGPFPFTVHVVIEGIQRMHEKVSERSERALRKTQAMDLAKWLQTAASTTKLTHSIRLARLVRSCFIKNAPCFARRSFMNATSDPPQKAF